ncbi:LZTR1 [Symbiodinium sp. CCMP2592]|nr:LZTR1 [Symbiodinium sp. CCMP2592]
MPLCFGSAAHLPQFEDSCSPLLQQQRSYSDTILRGAQVVVLLCGCFLCLLTIRSVAPSIPSPAAVVLADLELRRLPEAKKAAKSVEIVYKLGAERSGKKQKSDIARLLEIFAESSELVGHPIDSVISAATSLGSALGFSPQTEAQNLLDTAVQLMDLHFEKLHSQFDQIQRGIDEIDADLYTLHSNEWFQRREMKRIISTCQGYMTKLREYYEADVWVKQGQFDRVVHYAVAAAKQYEDLVYSAFVDKAVHESLESAMKPMAGWSQIPHAAAVYSEVLLARVCLLQFQLVQETWLGHDFGSAPMLLLLEEAASQLRQYQKSAVHLRIEEAAKLSMSAREALQNNCTAAIQGFGRKRDKVEKCLLFPETFHAAEKALQTVCCEGRKAALGYMTEDHDLSHGSVPWQEGTCPLGMMNETDKIFGCNFWFTWLPHGKSPGLIARAEPADVSGGDQSVLVGTYLSIFSSPTLLLRRGPIHDFGHWQQLDGSLPGFGVFPVFHLIDLTGEDPVDYISNFTMPRDTSMMSLHPSFSCCQFIALAKGSLWLDSDSEGVSAAGLQKTHTICYTSICCGCNRSLFRWAPYWNHVSIEGI